MALGKSADVEPPPSPGPATAPSSRETPPPTIPSVAFPGGVLIGDRGYSTVFLTEVNNPPIFFEAASILI